MLTEEQLAQRRKGICATDVAKIVGQAMYGCGEDVRLDKMGAGVPFVEHDRAKWGHLLEDPIRKDYAERHGVTVVSGDEIGTLQHPHEPWALATPDTMVYAHRGWRQFNHSPLRGHEIKSHISWLAHLYGEPGTDEVPPSELIQCAWNIWVASAFYGVQIERWDLTVFLDGLPTDYTILRDEELEATLIEACRNFWQEHVVGGDPVPPDGSKHYGEILKARWPKHDPGKVVEATEGQYQTIGRLRAARAARKGWEATEEELAQQVKLVMGDAECITFIDHDSDDCKTQKINWKQSKDSVKVDYKTYASSLEGLIRESVDKASISGAVENCNQALSGLKASHTTTKPGSRRFTLPRGF